MDYYIPHGAQLHQISPMFLTEAWSDPQWLQQGGKSPYPWSKWNAKFSFKYVHQVPHPFFATAAFIVHEPNTHAGEIFCL
jgi:hypothetical protein